MGDLWAEFLSLPLPDKAKVGLFVLAISTTAWYVLRWLGGRVSNGIASDIRSEVRALHDNLQGMHDFVEIAFEKRSHEEDNTRRQLVDMSRLVHQDIGLLRAEIRGDIRDLTKRVRATEAGLADVKAFGCAHATGRGNGDIKCEADQ